MCLQAIVKILLKGIEKMCGFLAYELCASPWLFDTMIKGYVLPYIAEPTLNRHANQQSAVVETDFVEIAVGELLGGGYVRRVFEQPHV